MPPPPPPLRGPPTGKSNAPVKISPHSFLAFSFGPTRLFRQRSGRHIYLAAVPAARRKPRDNWKKQSAYRRTRARVLSAARRYIGNAAELHNKRAHYYCIAAVYARNYSSSSVNEGQDYQANPKDLEPPLRATRCNNREKPSGATRPRRIHIHAYPSLLLSHSLGLNRRQALSANRRASALLAAKPPYRGTAIIFTVILGRRGQKRSKGAREMQRGPALL